MAKKTHTVTLVRTSETALSVFLDGKKVQLAPSLKARNHSPTGFNAGYGGSGPAQTALAILLKVLPKSLALSRYQEFKWTYLGNPKYLELGEHVFTFSLDKKVGK